MGFEVSLAYCTEKMRLSRQTFISPRQKFNIYGWRAQESTNANVQIAYLSVMFRCESPGEFISSAAARAFFINHFQHHRARRIKQPYINREFFRDLPMRYSKKVSLKRGTINNFRRHIKSATDLRNKLSISLWLDVFAHKASTISGGFRLR